MEQALPGLTRRSFGSDWQKGEFTEILRSMGSLAPENGNMGQAANTVRSQLEQMLNEAMDHFRQMEKQAELIWRPSTSRSRPGSPPAPGTC